MSIFKVQQQVKAVDKVLGHVSTEWKIILKLLECYNIH